VFIQVQRRLGLGLDFGLILRHCLSFSLIRRTTIILADPSEFVWIATSHGNSPCRFVHFLTRDRRGKFNAM
jgi:hypothetical protein